jgi:hypothetical protein
LVKLLVVPPSTRLSIHQNQYELEVIHKVSMNVNPWLGINCCHFITTNKKTPCYMNSSFSCGENYAMQKFYNLPSNIVISMVFWGVHLQELKKQFHGLKICERWLHCKSQKQQQIAKNLLYLFSNHILAYNYQVCHYVFSPTKEETFIFCMLWLCKHIKLTHIAVRSYNLVFVPLDKFLKIVEFWNQYFIQFVCKTWHLTIYAFSN